MNNVRSHIKIADNFLFTFVYILVYVKITFQEHFK